MTDTESRYIREYLDQNPRHLHAAYAVARAWPGVRDDICRRFLEHLRERVEERISEEMPEIREDLRVHCHYEGEKAWSNRLVVMRMIAIESKGPGPNSWYWGIPRNPDPKTLREELLAALKRRGLSLKRASPNWPQYEYLPRYGHWDYRVPELVQELTDGGGKITDYYVNGLLNMAEKAIPAFAEVELANQNTSALDDS